MGKKMGMEAALTWSRARDLICSHGHAYAPHLDIWAMQTTQMAAEHLGDFIAALYPFESALAWVISAQTRRLIASTSYCCNTLGRFRPEELTAPK
jgi:hypothetical protein